MIKFTTSWDDGHKLDLKLAELLSKYCLKGTFYISNNYIDDRLSEQEIKDISKSHEIGGHTKNHLDLGRIAINVAREEMSSNKKWLEDIINKDIKMFCYPFGRFNRDIKNLVFELGYQGARTTERLKLSFNDPFEMPITTHVYPYPLRKVDAEHYYWRKLFDPLALNGSKVIKLGINPIRFSWLSLARKIMDSAKDVDAVYHLYGHSHEIERYDMWFQLEEFFKYVKDNGVLAVNNSELTRPN